MSSKNNGKIIFSSQLGVLVVFYGANLRKGIVYDIHLKYSFLVMFIVLSMNLLC